MTTTMLPFRRALVLALGLGLALPAMAQSRKVDQQHLFHDWILLNTSVQADAPNSGLNLDKPGCAAVTYTIGSDGVPFDVEVVKVEPRSDLGSVARSAVSNFRYGPSLTNTIHRPVSTFYIVPFNAPDDPAQKQALIDACKVPGYGA